MNRYPKTSLLKCFLILIIVSITSTIANMDLDTLREYVSQEFENVEHQLDCLDAWKNYESPNDPVCLKPILGAVISRIEQNINFYKSWKYTDNERYKCLRLSKKNDPSQIVEDIKNLNIIMRRLRDLFKSLSLASNTIRYIKYELKPEIDERKLQDKYDLYNEYKIECDSLNGILTVTAELARRLIPAEVRYKLVPSTRSIIRVKQLSILKNF